MKIAYLYERPINDGEAMGAEKTFADWKTTRRAELVSMIEGKGIRSGDTLLIRATGDLGQGAEARRIQKTLDDLGVTIQVIPPQNNVRQRGRPARFKPTDAQKEHICALWYSPAPLDHVLGRVADIMGQEVKRDKLYYLCGPRDGSTKK